MSAGFAPAPPPEVEGGWDAFSGARPAGRVLKRYLANPTLVAGTVLLALYGVLALDALARYGSGWDVLTPDFALGAQLNPPGPSLSHPFGILSGIGVDELSALIQATPTDLAVIGGPILVAATVGIAIGAYSATVGRVGDFLLTALADLVSGVPPFFLVMVLFLGVQHLIRPSQYLLVFGLFFALVLFPYYARPVRARALEIVEEPYVEAARASGASRPRVLLRHVVPNSLVPVMAQIPVDVGNILFVLTVFPYLGCLAGQVGNAFYGALTPLPAAVYPEWGYLLAEGACFGWSPVPSGNHWWMYAFPALVIVGFGVAVSLACDGVVRAISLKRSA